MFYVNWNEGMRRFRNNHLKRRAGGVRMPMERDNYGFQMSYALEEANDKKERTYHIKETNIFTKS